MIKLEVAALFFFWLVCEVVILSFIVSFWNKTVCRNESRMGVKVLVALSAVMLAVVFARTFYLQSPEELLFHRDPRVDRHVQYQLTVDMYCTLYVLLESLITLYAAAILRAAKFYLQSRAEMVPGEHFDARNRRVLFGVAALVGSFGALHFLYHHVYASVVRSGQLDTVYVFKSFHFYYFVCGFLWIAVDMVAAFIAFRLWRLLAANRELIHGIR